MSNWANDILEVVTPKKVEGNTLLIARVISPSPLSIEVNGQKITKKVYKTTGISEDFSEGIFSDRPIIASWFPFLKNWHKEHKLFSGDLVICMKSMDDFFVLAKVRR